MFWDIMHVSHRTSEDLDSIDIYRYYVVIDLIYIYTYGIYIAFGVMFMSSADGSD